jgi:hypothetical protein
MPLHEQLQDVILTDAEKKQLALIERAAPRSTLLLVLNAVAISALFASPAAAYAYLLQRGSEGGLAICKLQHGVYMPQDDTFDRLLHYPITFICTIAVIGGLVFFQLQRANRSMYKILVRCGVLT